MKLTKGQIEKLIKEEMKGLSESDEMNQRTVRRAVSKIKHRASQIAELDREWGGEEALAKIAGLLDDMQSTFRRAMEDLKGRGFQTTARAESVRESKEK